MTDTLTNIPSIKSLEESLEKATHPKLILIDLKEFRELNLKYSDKAGDFVLCEFAEALETFSKKNGMFAYRVEEDEFALLKDMPFDLGILEKLIFSIDDFIKNQEYIFDGNNINIEAHMGICLDQNNLLEKAKKALKIAQQEDQPFVTYSQFVNTLLEESDEQICKLLEKAVSSGSITPFFQKVIDANKNKIYSETLIRIVHKDSIQSPKLFLDIAKKRGFYTKTIQALVEKMIDIKEPKAINISCEDLYDENLYKIYTKSFQNSNTIFELQNDEFLDDDRIFEKIKELKKKNIKICLDNIDSIENTKRLDVDFIKVKGDLIRLLHIDQNAISTCKEIISTCKEKNIKTIATHINSDNSFEEAKKLGFDYFQGFFIQKPTSTFAG